MTASSSNPRSTPENGAERSRRPVRCPKCRQPNTSPRGTCESCGSHLYVSCRDCGERNERGRRRCSACGRRLHRPFLQRILTRKLGKTTKITPLQIVLLVIAVALGYKMVIYFVESMSQSPGGEAARMRISERAEA